VVFCCPQAASGRLSGGTRARTDEHLARLHGRYEQFTEALKLGDTAVAQASGADFGTIVILAGGNVELQALVDQVVLRSLRMLRLSSDSDSTQPSRAWRPSRLRSRRRVPR